MWTNLSPSFFGPRISLIGDYLILYYIKNNGAAFSLFANSIVLVLLIAVAIGVIAYLYIRNINTASLWYKLIFGLIIGGALSNLIDRVRHGGYVVDFISFNIPQLNFHFAIFNLADAAISIGVVLLFITLLFESVLKPEEAAKKEQAAQETSLIPPTSTGSEVIAVFERTRCTKLALNHLQEMLTLSIQADEAGMRLDRYLTTRTA